MHEITWENDHRVLHVTHGPGMWSNEDFDEYEGNLITALETAPPSGFQLLLDQSEATPQTPAMSDRRMGTLGHLLKHGMMKAIIIAPKTVTAMQTQRIIRQSGADPNVFEVYKTQEEATAALHL